MKIYIISGEKSGDLHGSNLATEMYKKDNTIKLRGFGGDKMKESGVKVVKHINQLSFMGFTEVIKNLSKIKENLSFCKNDIIKFNPDKIILIDFPGFNLRIAKFAKQRGIKVYYYISPKVWAWKKNRVEQIRNYVDELIVIFPFEVDFFNKNNIRSHYFGNPLTDLLDDKIKTLSSDKKIISILPGSRKQEVKKNLPVMIKLTKEFPDYNFIIASTDAMFTICKEISSGYDILIEKENTYSVLKSSELALVTSGTATLETALLNVPQIVCYKTDKLTYLLAKLFVKIKWISLVNIIMNKEVVKELIQNKMNIESLKLEMSLLLSDSEKMKINYKELKEILKSDKVSDKISEFILT
jgi:lipid-A-disaccharide synthase